MLNRLLDGLASRLGLAVAIVTVVAVALAAAIYFSATADRLAANQKRFDTTQYRNAVVAISDIQRATLILQGTTGLDALSGALRGDFTKALDILYVRHESLKVKSADEDAVRSAEVVSGRLRDLVDEGDRLLSASGKAFRVSAKEFLQNSEAARRVIIRYIDEQRRIESEVVARQNAVLREQWVVLMALVPVMSGTVLGALFLLRREVLSRRARETAEARVNYLAFFDPLTGLANRVQFQDRTSELLDGPGPVALLLLDLDAFKEINDTYGHAIGDAVLVHAAAILRDVSAAENGVAARLGGDEFAIALSTDDATRLTRVCDRLIARFSEPLVTDVEQVRIGVSIGLAATTQLSAAIDSDYDSLCRVTDFALYASKSAGRGRYTFYDKALEARYLERKAMLEELPIAAASGELEVFFQPKYDFDAGMVTSFEALVRWRRKGVLVSPGDFIQLAEESGLIGQIDFFVLAEATRIVAAWNDAHDVAYGVSVNLSATHFNGRGVAGEVRAALAASGLPPEFLTLEITESVQIHDWENVEHVLAAFRNMGCRISIDDFGTGYSSLAQVKALNADELKIDRSLIIEIEESRASCFVLDAIVDLAGNFGMKVVAEGVETRKQAEIVRDLGVGTIQGYLLGPPIPAEKALAEAPDHHVDLPRKAVVPPPGLTPAADRAAPPPPSDRPAPSPAATPASPSRRAAGG